MSNFSTTFDTNSNIYHDKTNQAQYQAPPQVVQAQPAFIIAGHAPPERYCCSADSNSRISLIVGN